MCIEPTTRFTRAISFGLLLTIEIHKFSLRNDTPSYCCGSESITTQSMARSLLIILTVTLVMSPLTHSFARFPTAFSTRPFLRSQGFTLAKRSLTVKGKTDGFDSEKFVSLQKDASHRGPNFETEEAFLENQQRVFDDLAPFFASDEAIPEELVPVFQHLGKRIIFCACTSRQASMDKRQAPKPDGVINEDDTEKQIFPRDRRLRILDVACGTGPLFGVLIDAANAANISLDIVGVDLSSEMVSLANDHAHHILATNGGTDHTIQVNASDILKYQHGEGEKLFDIVSANACFGNFWNQSSVLSHLSDMLAVDGSLFVTHPLGAGFVQTLHEEDPNSVPHLLPTSPGSWNSLLKCLPLELRSLQEKADILGEVDMKPAKRLYFAHLQRVRRRLWTHVLRLRGKVDSGYGRGGKKLGFPTANLPSRLFQNALQDVPAGVYFGWALLESDELAAPGRNIAHKAVVNVGFSPTFEGQENAEKIVEAHLMAEEPLTDFYNETMRLQLHGFLRPEIKFSSFPDLIKQINADVVDAKEALDVSPFVGFKSDLFFSQGRSWIGKDGGDDKASWEFEDIRSGLYEAGQ